jgi:hypothetical protein
MSSCPLCEAGARFKVQVPLCDPKTGIPTGQTLSLSRELYDRIMKVATEKKDETS